MPTTRSVSVAEVLLTFVFILFLLVIALNSLIPSSVVPASNPRNRVLCCTRDGTREGHRQRTSPNGLNCKYARTRLHLAAARVLRCET
jgi:hypothetical protein